MEAAAKRDAEAQKNTTGRQKKGPKKKKRDEPERSPTGFRFSVFAISIPRLRTTDNTMDNTAIAHAIYAPRSIPRSQQPVCREEPGARGVAKSVIADAQIDGALRGDAFTSLSSGADALLAQVPTIDCQCPTHSKRGRCTPALSQVSAARATCVTFTPNSGIDVI